MTNEELLNLFHSLNELKNLTGVKIAYAVAKNINILKNEVMAIAKAIEPSEEYKRYDKERIELAKKYAKKENGKEVIRTITEGDKTIQEYVIDNQEEFEKEFEKLKKKYKKAIDEWEKQKDEFKKLLKEEAKVNLYKINIKDIPKEISVSQLLGIYPIIEE